MIKKNTKIIIKEGNKESELKLEGGIPLSKKDIINIKDKGKNNKYEVIDKIINANLDNEIVDITYVLKLIK